MLDNAIFDLHKAIRNRLLVYLEKVTAEQLAIIPEGFHNNILWNISHCVVTEQLLCYRMAGIPTLVKEELINTCRKGTYPDGHIPTTQEIDNLKELLTYTGECLQKDYMKGLFKEYPTYATSFGYTLHTIEEAILFNNTHEGMHLGVIIALNYHL